MARTRDRFEFSCSPTITTGLYSVSANWTEEVVDMNTGAEVKDDTEDSEDDNTGEVKDDIEDSVTKTEGMNYLLEALGIGVADLCDNIGMLGGGD